MCRRLSIPYLARDELTSNAHPRPTLTGSQLECLHYDRTERSPQERAWRRSIAASLKLLFSAHEPSGGMESHWCPGHTTRRVGVSHLTGITSASGSPAKAPRTCMPYILRPLKSSQYRSRDMLAELPYRVLPVGRCPLLGMLRLRVVGYASFRGRSASATTIPIDPSLRFTSSL